MKMRRKSIIRPYLLTVLIVIAICINVNLVNAQTETESFMVSSERMLDDSLLFWEITGAEIRGAKGKSEIQTQKVIEVEKKVEIGCVFSLAEQKYGVHQETLHAQWQRESKESADLGNSNPLRVMRGKQLEAYKKICKSLGINPSGRKVSRTGDMGPLQFQPVTWLAYGVDANGDGKADPWNLEDAVMSAAKYLSELNYQKSPWTALSKYNGGSKSAGSRRAQQYAGNVLRTAIKKGAPIKL
jgi:membrane-bound lytic murein transglycosylase B